MKTRGEYNFEIDVKGKILPNQANLQKLRALLLDRKLINDEILGPGDHEDYLIGSWHIFCHLTAACAVFKKRNNYIWTEISHVPLIDEYITTVTVDSSQETVCSFPLYSSVGQKIIHDAKLLGFIEGTSFGHISAIDVQDKPEDFNKNYRQEYDNDELSMKEGGRVWEHWVVTRDISEKSHIGSSILQAYLEMLSICGGIYSGIVGRSRSDYHHPEQLKALKTAGLLNVEEVLFDITPKSIPQSSALKIFSANPKICLETVKDFSWDLNKVSFFMFQRKIDKWNAKENLVKFYKSNIKETKNE